MSNYLNYHLYLRISSDRRYHQEIGVLLLFIFEQFRDQDKTAFDWCKEGNIKEMTNTLERKKIGANVQDDMVNILFQPMPAREDKGAK